MDTITHATESFPCDHAVGLRGRRRTDGSCGEPPYAIPPSVDCSVPAGAIQARVVTGRGTQSIEVLASDVAGPLVPLACADLVPRCGYELSLLTPVGDLVPATFTVDAGTLRHNVEYCTCCNGEDGGSDEAFGTYEEQETFLAIEAVSDACVVGWYETDSTRIEFVAERCAF